MIEGNVGRIARTNLIRQIINLLLKNGLKIHNFIGQKLSYTGCITHLWSPPMASILLFDLAKLPRDDIRHSINASIHAVSLLFCANNSMLLCEQCDLPKKTMWAWPKCKEYKSSLKQSHTIPYISENWFKTLKKNHKGGHYRGRRSETSNITLSMAPLTYSIFTRLFQLKASNKPSTSTEEASSLWQEEKTYIEHMVRKIDASRVSWKGSNPHHAVPFRKSFLSHQQFPSSYNNWASLARGPWIENLQNHTSIDLQENGTKVTYLTPLKLCAPSCLRTSNWHAHIYFLHKGTMVMHCIPNFFLHILLDCICQLQDKGCMSHTRENCKSAVR